MPTKQGTIWAHNIGWRNVWNSTDEVTINFAAPRNITATYMLSQASVLTISRQDDFNAHAAISRYIQDGQLREVTGGVPRLQADRVTSVTFWLRARDCVASAVYNIFFWE